MLGEIKERLLADLDCLEADFRCNTPEASACADERESPFAARAVFGEPLEDLREVVGRADGIAAGNGGAAMEFEGDESVDVRGLEVAPAVVEGEEREAVVAVRFDKPQPPARSVFVARHATPPRLAVLNVEYTLLTRRRSASQCSRNGWGSSTSVYDNENDDAYIGIAGRSH